MALQPYNYMNEEFESFEYHMSCRNVIQIPFEKRCDYIRNAHDCLTAMTLVNYVTLVHCELEVSSNFEEVLVTIVFILISFCLILGIAITADSYLAPALKIISKLLHMNEHLTGITFIAFANSSPVLFTNFWLIGEKNVPYLANCLSIALFVTLIVGGTIMYICPFRMDPYHTLLDMLFFLLGIITIEYFIVNDQRADLFEVMCILGLYALYLTTNIVDMFMINFSIRMLKQKIEHLEAHGGAIEDIRKREDELSDLEGKMKRKVKRNLRRSRSIQYDELAYFALSISDESLSSTRRDEKTTYQIDPSLIPEHITRDMLYNPNNPKNFNLIQEFCWDLNPFDESEWENAHCMEKCLILFMFPIKVICALLVPRVDVEMDKHGWSKLLNICHLLIVPSTLVAFVWTYGEIHKHEYLKNFAVTFIVIVIPISILLMVFVFFTSRTDRPPPYHHCYTILSCISSILIIFVCACEIDEMLALTGAMLNLSEGYMGVTLAAIAAGTCDLVTNLTLCMHGYEEMAFAACYGAPFFGTMVSIGICFFFEVMQDDNFSKRIVHGTYGENAFVFSMISLCSSILWIIFLDFRSRRSMGIFCFITYFLYLLYATFAELEIIHNFGYDKLQLIVPERKMYFI